VCAALGIDAEEAVEQAGYGEASTVGGLLCALAGRIPRAGDQIPFSGYVFTVREVEDGRLILNVGAKRMIPALPVVQAAGAAGAGQWGLRQGSSHQTAERGHESDQDSEGQLEWGLAAEGEFGRVHGAREEDQQDDDEGGSSLGGADGADAAAEGQRRRHGAAYDLSSFPDVLDGPDSDASAAEEDARTAAPEGGGAASGRPGPARRAYFEGDWVEEWLGSD
jgi:hypothetical protein